MILLAAALALSLWKPVANDDETFTVNGLTLPESMRPQSFQALRDGTWAAYLVPGDTAFVWPSEARRPCLPVIVLPGRSVAATGGFAVGPPPGLRIVSLAGRHEPSDLWRVRCKRSGVVGAVVFIQFPAGTPAESAKAVSLGPPMTVP